MSRNFTLLSKLGFQDIDKQEPEHDLACEYISQNEVLRQIIYYLYPRSNRFKRQIENIEYKHKEKFIHENEKSIRELVEKSKSEFCDRHLISFGMFKNSLRELNDDNIRRFITLGFLPSNFSMDIIDDNKTEMWNNALQAYNNHSRHYQDQWDSILKSIDGKSHLRFEGFKCFEGFQLPHNIDTFRMKIENIELKLPDKIDCKKESPINKGTNQYKTTIGFADVLVPNEVYDVIVTYSYEIDGTKTLDQIHEDTTYLGFLFEVKTTVQVSDFLRQMNLYLEYFKSSPVPVLVTTSSITEAERLSIAAEGIEIIELGPSFTEWRQKRAQNFQKKAQLPLF